MLLSVRDFSASGYRSLRQIAYPVSDLEVFVGANGVGKSNLYRALELLRSAAANTLGQDLAREGMDAAFWAGTRRRQEPRRIALSVGLAANDRRGVAFKYEVEIGFPPSEASSAFPVEPQVKTEALIFLGGSRPVRMMDRKGPSIMVRGEDGRPVQADLDLLSSETVLGRLEDPSKYPGLDEVRRTLLEWRFYHDLRTDADSPIRRPCVAVATPTLASDGANLAAVFATLVHIREDAFDLGGLIDQAFPGAKLVVPPPGRMANFGMRFPDFPDRVFDAAELSDGTLRFLALAGALMAYRRPPFIALNEPESSLHPDLMEPLAKLVARASEVAQVWMVTHSERLAKAISDTTSGAVRTVTKIDGATTIEGLTRLGQFRDG